MPGVVVASSSSAADPEAPRRLTLVRGADRASSTIRVAVADGRALVRAGFRALLEREPAIAVVGEAATGDELVALARRTRPQVVLVDVHLPGLDHAGATRRLLAEPGAAVMLLAGSEADERVVAALRAGARGVLARDADPAELVRAVKALATGATALPPGCLPRLAADEHARGAVVIPLHGARAHRPGRAHASNVIELRRRRDGARPRA